MVICIDNRQFSHPRVFNAPAKGVPLGIGYRCRGQKTRTMWLPDGRKSFKIGFAILIQYRHVTNTQPASQPRCRNKDHAYVYVAWVKTGAAQIQYSRCVK